MSEAIRAVIFDVGGVLVRTFDHSGRRAWERRLGLAEGAADAVVFHSEGGQRAQRGESSDADQWEWVGTHLGLNAPDLAAFRRDFWRGDAVDTALLDLIHRLRPRYQTAIISNATDALHAWLDYYGLSAAFDVVVGSAYEKIMKPDPVIYERTLARLGRHPAEAVFIDDAPANVAGARAVGMWAIPFTPGMDLEWELEKVGVRVASGR
jgi:putative hydrolase of the HAD superfamily